MAVMAVMVGGAQRTELSESPETGKPEIVPCGCGSCAVHDAGFAAAFGCPKNETLRMID
jgi:hypothetical protein